MIKTFEIEFVNKALEKALNDNDYKVVSFYEPLNELKDVAFYQALYQDIIEELNETKFKAIGVVATTKSPTITSIKKSFISPFEFGVNLRTKALYRDEVVQKVYEVIDQLKGRKIELVQLIKDEQLVNIVPVGVLLQESEELKSGDFVGTFVNLPVLQATLERRWRGKKHFEIIEDFWYKLYALIGMSTKRKLYSFDVIFDNNGGYTMSNLTLVGEHDKCEFYKLDLSFDSIRIDNPNTLNKDDFCVIMLGGSATLCSANVMLGNDLVQVGIRKYKENGVVLEDQEYEFVEPLDMPNDYKTDILSYGLLDNGFKGSEHIQGYSSDISYSFIIDKESSFIYDTYRQTRYLTSTTPNTIYQIMEVWSSFGNIEKNIFIAKMTNGVKVDKGDNDVLSLSIPFSIVGENE